LINPSSYDHLPIYNPNKFFICLAIIGIGDGMSEVLQLVEEFNEKYRVYVADRYGIELAVLVALSDEEKRREMEKCIEDSASIASRSRCVFKVAGIEDKWNKILNDIARNKCEDECFGYIGLDGIDDEELLECDTVVDKVLEKCVQRYLASIEDNVDQLLSD
jgi:hypothetical protein